MYIICDMLLYITSIYIYYIKYVLNVIDSKIEKGFLAVEKMYFVKIYQNVH